MFHPVTDDTPKRRRFGIMEVVLVAAILAFGGFTLLADGRLSLDNMLEGVSDTLQR